LEGVGMSSPTRKVRIFQKVFGAIQDKYFRYSNNEKKNSTAFINTENAGCYFIDDAFG
jgi:hypothetical protein